MKRLYLVSSSKVHGHAYLHHCEEDLLCFFEGVQRVYFVPWAVQNHDAYTAKVRQRFSELGLELISLHECADPAAALRTAQALFIGGGNTFRLLTALYAHDVLGVIRQRVLDEGMRYMGSSAGTNMACPTLKTTNDMPIVQPPAFDALGLVSFQINPHYLDVDLGSTHMGETREDRIREFHEMNAAPVVGLREGAQLWIEGERVELHGIKGARIFRRGCEPEEAAPGAVLSL
ncbi:MAG: dipeptidase PepE [Planctomycetes bacterium]|nr:dipeptidase PepE [Planctomycetota bacterium]